MTLSVGPVGVELTTSRVTTRCSANWATVMSAYSKIIFFRGWLWLQILYSFTLPFVAITLQNTSLKIDHERDGITKASLAAPAIACGKMTREGSISLFWLLTKLLGFIDDVCNSNLCVHFLGKAGRFFQSRFQLKSFREVYFHCVYDNVMFLVLRPRSIEHRRKFLWQ